MLAEPSLAAWGAIGLAELGLLTDNLEFLRTGVDHFFGATQGDDRQDVRSLKLSYEAHLLARQRKARTAETLLEANTAIVDSYFYCTFMVGGFVDRSEFQSISTLRKKCKQFEQWPVYAIELNRATYYEKGPKVSEKQLRRMAEKWPNSFEVRRHLLELRIANITGRERIEAIDEYKKLALSEPLFPPVVLRYANLVIDYELPPAPPLSAVDRLGKDVKHFTSYHLLLAKLASRLKKYDEAWGHLRTAMSRAPANIDILEEGARLSEVTNNMEEAIRWLEPILELQPSNASALQRLLNAAVAAKKCSLAQQVLGKLEKLPQIPASSLAVSKESALRCI